MLPCPGWVGCSRSPWSCYRTTRAGSTASGRYWAQTTTLDTLARHMHLTWHLTWNLTLIFPAISHDRLNVWRGEDLHPLAAPSTSSFISAAGDTMAPGWSASLTWEARLMEKERRAPKGRSNQRPIRSKIGNDDHRFRPTVEQSHTSHGSLKIETIVLCRQLATPAPWLDAWRGRTEIPQPCSRDLVLDSCLSLYDLLRTLLSRALT